MTSTNFAIIPIAGFVGTSVMLIVMSIMHHLKLANADMVRAIGSIYTRTYEGSLLPGLIIHYTIGLFFAFIYAFIVQLSPVVTPSSTIILATFAGLAHGMIVGLSLQVMVAVYHPVEQFRKAGFAVVIAHIIGHTFYGLSVGLVYAHFWEQMALRSILFSR